MSHPCDGHACDHCYLCDVVGVCCGTVAPEQRAQLEADASRPNDARLRKAIESERGDQPSIAELVRRDAALHAPAALPASPILALPAPLEMSEPIENRKEPVYVVPPRTAR